MIPIGAMVRLLLLGALHPLAIQAQGPPASSQSSVPMKEKFEVASIKACNLSSDGGRSGGGTNAGSDPGRLRLECQTVENLIRLAYIRFANGRGDRRTGAQPIDGGPAWVKSDRYTIDAKPETPQTVAMMRGPMLQALLEDRFQLRIRHDIKDVPVYALGVAKGGPSLKPRRRKAVPLSSFD
jgi:uncharacterized protein (TIGR03435 family)